MGKRAVGLESTLEAMFQEANAKWEANKNLPTYDTNHPARLRARAIQEANIMIRFGLSQYKTLEQLTDDEVVEALDRYDKVIQCGIRF